MLLQRLSEYAESLGLPPPMYQKVDIRYIIRLDQVGNRSQLIDCATQTNKRGVKLPAPDCMRSSGDRPILFADHAEYTLGIPRKNSTAEAVHRRHSLYLELVKECALAVRDTALEAVLHFLATFNALSPGLVLPEDFDPTAKITFEVSVGPQTLRPIDLPAVQQFWAQKMSPGDISHLMQCLVCGEERPPVARLPIKIQGIPGGQPSGMVLISANAPAFESFGLEESRIAPTCEACGQRFGTALNTLLEHPDTHVTISSLVYIFWTRQQIPFQFGSMLSRAEPADVQRLLTSPWRSRETQIDLMPFYAAAFSASNARIVVRDWIETTLGSAQAHLKRYFQLQRIVDTTGIPRWFPLWQLVNATISQKSKEKAGPQVGKTLLHLALHGGSLPGWLLYQVVRSIRADRNIQPSQAAVIKMVLLSQEDLSWIDHSIPFGAAPNTTERENDMTELDLTCNDAAYLCGRLLAELAEIQYQALGDIGSNIIDRYYGTASSAPASVFGRLLRGAQPHMAVLSRDKKGAYFRLDEQLQEILSHFEEKKFPATLDLMAQGRFALGFYQQRAANRNAMLQAIQKKAALQQKEAAPAEAPIEEISSPK
jgi:CRISPR-associated protein Csd1